ncbi:hypothetical protein [Prosthecomicrobium sp. N25]|uniref:hypothetical protein n=1 Tax=Prosthecomicrobium sp. N25 TaxID=3129254 RepID=UPI00307748B0
MAAYTAQQAEIDNHLINLLIDTAPEDWNAVVLMVEPRPGLDGAPFMAKIVNPDVSGPELEVPGEIRELLTALVAHFATAKREWTRMTYSAWNRDGNWQAKVSVPAPGQKPEAAETSPRAH